MKNPRIYLDYNATAPLLPIAREAMLDVLAMPGNPSSVHSEGRKVRARVDDARRKVAALVNASPENVVFTSGATEAASTLLSPLYRMGRSNIDIGHLYYSAVEHPCVTSGGRFPADRITSIDVDSQGRVDLGHLKALLDQHDSASGMPMVAVMLANNETGVIQPVADVSGLVKAAGGLLIGDAVQAAGRIPIDMQTPGADFIFLSSHKMGGPKGAGAIVAQGEIMMPAPLITGGGQEKGHRSGTENPAALAGFGAVAQAALEGMDTMQKVARLRDRMEQDIRMAVPDAIIYGGESRRLPNTSFFALPGFKAETAQIAFDLEGVALSAGSACSSGKIGPSHVLKAMGMDADQGALRVSLGPATTEEEIDRFVSILKRISEKRTLAV
ncbi:cysteine desulfurase [Hoeflea sp. WL0058]|uniref:Cysteine desulfurase n=1 Tax=Flavimaribacter sediminis TaxID=2865987 RepID=A0AAE2ZM16_9HYPH|nr:cysteine desulfurase family protein [Flavimaribacter sediminis]MBW8637092.1 cysteine desulfurase [Flavimaribacter sediminis]